MQLVRLLATISLIMFGSPTYSGSAHERAHTSAMSAYEECRSTWFQSRREAALKEIRDRGTFMATTLNPNSKDFELNMRLLSEVTAALKDCGEIVLAN